MRILQFDFTREMAIALYLNSGASSYFLLHLPIHYMGLHHTCAGCHLRTWIRGTACPSTNIPLWPRRPSVRVFSPERAKLDFGSRNPYLITWEASQLHLLHLQSLNQSGQRLRVNVSFYNNMI